ncbi:MAG: carbamoyl-phosphate synthase large subunit, partial [Spirochaetales bacterium]|nr:carbamoyl-phosphate synthase large subunit [Spirochaetales bacterium]
MPRRNDIHHILVIGSGPIVIGQACEFDYSGNQAVKTLKEEGYEVSLINPNPATMMTTPGIADHIFLEPLTTDYVEKIFQQVGPDAILSTMGGQTALNLTMELDRKGLLEKYGVKVIGASIESIRKAEDRGAFKDIVSSIGLESARSTVVHDLEEAKAARSIIPLPIIIRPSYTLGGMGGSIANTEEEYLPMVEHALEVSPAHEALLEESLIGWKEFEMEVMRDSKDNAIIVCSIENIDPMGVHTGDSITIAPIQTLNDRQYQRMRNASIDILRAVGVDCGGSNVQFAMQNDTDRMIVIEMNPRVSRSSALASKASGYPIARVTAKIAMGMLLEEIPVAGGTAAIEPSLDYIVAKFPRFPFDKFASAPNTLGTQMKATGEVMGIGSTLEECMMKSVRSLEIGACHFHLPKFDGMSDAELLDYISAARDDNVFAITELLRRGATVEKLHAVTQITALFLESLERIVAMEARLKENVNDIATLRAAKEMGFSDRYIAALWHLNEVDIYARRKQHGITPVFRMVDTLHTGAYIAYLYSSYTGRMDSRLTDRKKIVVLGAGPIRIGQGVEFDYSTVHAVQTIRRAGYEAIIINNNPETVSTDYTTADKLYFEPLTPEDVMAIIDYEKPEGVIASLGGQTAINLAQPLSDRGVKIIGTDCAAIERAEDRDAFEHVL